MAFTVLIPARMASTRLPDKPLADIAGLPMVVRVAQQASLSGAQAVVVAADSERIVAACGEHGVQAILTRTDHVSGSDRLAEASAILGLHDDEVVVNVQGDEPLMPPLLVQAVARLLEDNPGISMSTAAHAIDSEADFLNPNIVKVVLDARRRAMYFSRAPIPFARDRPNGWSGATDHGGQHAEGAWPLRHVGIYGYRAGFLRQFPGLGAAPVEAVEALEQLRVLWHGHHILVHIAAAAPAPGVDTPEDLVKVRALFR